MKIFVTGGTGFVGSRLVPFLVQAGHRVHLLLRDQERRPPAAPVVTVSVGDPNLPGPWWEPLAGCDAAVNLAGHPIFCRWTAKVKALIRDSRIATTRNLVAALPGDRPFPLVSASGIGIYGDGGERELDEDSPRGGDFLARVAQDWEAEALRGANRGARVCCLRLGVVFGPDGGALPELVRNVRQRHTGRLGTGRQWMSWIHREDAVAGIRFLLENPALSGPFNFAAPEPRRQADVAHTLGQLLDCHHLVPAPLFAIRVMLGEAAELAQFSQRGVPRRLLEAGFRFQHPHLEPALQELLAAMP
ncbi:MAG: TIGR01777 family oxidoreductase [Deferrisomatales bacterium]|nr:TIGR01777 family oxidoreductase [Deferrisomatales bacterium]